MNEALFMGEVQEWLDDVRSSCVELFTAGVCAEHCLRIATQIADSKAAKRALTRQTSAARLTIPSARMVGPSS